MKRCPECDFLYLDSDQVCDLDGAPLENVEAGSTTSEIEMVPESIRQSWKTFAMLVIPGIVFGAILFVVYNWVAQRRTSVTKDVTNLTTSEPPPQLEPSPQSVPSPEESPTPIGEPSKSPAAKASPAKVTSSTPARLSSKPISTESYKAEKHGMIIRLSDGRTIAADEAWRTKDGIWYRRKGVVTLLKREQVKAIEKAP